MSYDCSLFIFRRDLRLEDNTALIRAMESSCKVVAAFILDPRQCQPHDYFSPKAFAFLRQSLDELSLAIERKGGRLYQFYGRSDEVIEDLLDHEKVDAVFINKDYTPFSRQRDGLIRKLCRQRGVAFEECDDVLLFPPGSVLKGAGGPYTVFTPFYKKSLTLTVAPVRRNEAVGFFLGELKSSFFLKASLLPKVDEVSVIAGGRAAGRANLSGVGIYKDYPRDRDIPAKDATTHLSAHLKFGTVSVREAHAALFKLGEGNMLLQQLYWRDFFTHIGFFFPHVFGNAFYDEYNYISWQNNKRLFAAWREGRTGFPLVDAGMRELNATGFMHNRVRMVAASFLVKDLHIDWRWGEKYFAQRLVDYDPAVNNGNWQWAASTGCDHQPYFRVFNPELQQKRFDPAFEYITKWVAEFNTQKYPAPVIYHPDAAAWSKEAFKAASRRTNRD
ncbi:MAG: deoxyribodipyrimidine photo-lyase [Candidatus Omnitrophica bacterium]|nr:deoxyribodipyrimidine photo-lyase [Candidatus Omnitrophota bacterium]